METKRMYCPLCLEIHDFFERDPNDTGYVCHRDPSKRNYVISSRLAKKVQDGIPLHHALFVGKKGAGKSYLLSAFFYHLFDQKHLACAELTEHSIRKGRELRTRYKEITSQKGPVIGATPPNILELPVMIEAKFPFKEMDPSKKSVIFNLLDIGGETYKQLLSLLLSFRVDYHDDNPPAQTSSTPDSIESDDFFGSSTTTQPTNPTRRLQKLKNIHTFIFVIDISSSDIDTTSYEAHEIIETVKEALYQIDVEPKEKNAIICLTKADKIFNQSSQFTDELTRRLKETRENPPSGEPLYEAINRIKRRSRVLEEVLYQTRHQNWVENLRDEWKSYVLIDVAAINEEERDSVTAEGYHVIDPLYWMAHLSLSSVSKLKN